MAPRLLIINSLSGIDCINIFNLCEIILILQPPKKIGAFVDWGSGWLVLAGSGA